MCWIVSHKGIRENKSQYKWKDATVNVWRIVGYPEQKSVRNASQITCSNKLETKGRDEKRNRPFNYRTRKEDDQEESYVEWIPCNLDL